MFDRLVGRDWSQKWGWPCTAQQRSRKKTLIDQCAQTVGTKAKGVKLRQVHVRDLGDHHTRPRQVMIVLLALSAGTFLHHTKHFTEAVAG